MTYPQPGDLDAVRGRYEAMRRHAMAIARDIERVPNLHATCMNIVSQIDDAMADVSEHQFVRKMQDDAVEKAKLRLAPTPWKRNH